jgi:type VI secretion system protein VasJ
MTYRSLGVRPVTESNPQGQDIRYEDLFLHLTAEIEKLSSPTDRDAFSWETVAHLASTVLRDHSKDLLAASYLSVALIHLRKDVGLDESTQILNDLLHHFWETLYPAKRRAAARVSALNWWLEKTLAGIGPNGGWSLTPDTAQMLCDRLIGMDRFLADHLDGSPSLDPLIRKINERTEANAPDKAPAQPVKAVTPPEDIPVPDMRLDSPDEAIKALRPVFRKIRQTSRLLRDEQLSNPQAYRWLRFAVWEPVRTLPPAVDHVTRIEAPVLQTVNHLDHLLRDEDYEALIHASESSLANPRNMFLIDLNRYTWLALSRLGDRFRGACDTVYFETKMFVFRLNGLDTCVFSNGTPFVNEESREWLRDQSKSYQQQSDRNDLSQSGRDLSAQGEIKSIREHYGSTGSLTDTIGLFEQKIRGGVTRRESTIFRLELARFLAQEKKEALSAAHLDVIWEDLDRHDLATWEPSLALDVLTLMYRVFKKLPDRRKEQAGQVLGRIAKISTLEALAL